MNFGTLHSAKRNTMAAPSFTIHMDNTELLEPHVPISSVSFLLLSIKLTKRNATFSTFLHCHPSILTKAVKSRLFQLTWATLWKCPLSPLTLQHFALKSRWGECRNTSLSTPVFQAKRMPFIGNRAVTSNSSLKGFCIATYSITSDMHYINTT